MTAPIEVSAGAAEAAPEAVLSGIGPSAIQGRSLGQIAWMRLRRDKVAIAGGVFVVFLVLVAIAGPFLVQNPVTFHSDLINATYSRPNGPSAGSAWRIRSASSRSMGATYWRASSSGPGTRC